MLQKTRITFLDRMAHEREAEILRRQVLEEEALVAAAAALEEENEKKAAAMIDKEEGKDLLKAAFGKNAKVF